MKARLMAGRAVLPLLDGWCRISSDLGGFSDMLGRLVVDRPASLRFRHVRSGAIGGWGRPGAIGGRGVREEAERVPRAAGARVQVRPERIKPVFG